MSKYYLMAIFSILITFGSQANTIHIQEVLKLDINSAINPATLNYLKAGFEEAQKNQNDLIMIKMNTPGGLVTTTKEILTLIGQSDIPILIWIAPEGASATSAGAIIASGAHLLIMSDGTNIGAATPITMQGDIKQKDLKSKAINDLVALVQSLAEARKRNGKLFGMMVQKAASYKAKEAYKKNLIDGIANSQKELSKVINGKTIVLKGKSFKIKANQVNIRYFEMDLGQKLLNIFANPALAYILFLIGAALIYLELQAPGGFIAGSIGVIALILAGIGFQILPLNFGAFGLIIVSFVLFVLEIYITSYGILSLAGLAALIFGSLFLFRTDNAYLALSNSVIISSVAAVTLFMAFIASFFIKDSLKKKERSFFSLKGKEGTIVSIDENGNYQVKVQGEIWKAKSPTLLEVGDFVIVEDQNEMELILRKIH